MHDQDETFRFDRILDIAREIEMTDDVLLRMLERKGVGGTFDTLLQATVVMRRARHGEFAGLPH
jgi:hypothetical protein